MVHRTISSDADNIFVQAENPTSLTEALRKLDISVPPRTCGRTTNHREVWAIARLLATLANSGHIPYPISVYHRDRPDISMICSQIEIGIEITEAIPPNYAEYCALAEREFPNALLEPALFYWGAPERSVEDMRAILSQGRLTSDGWVGDRPEQEWALFIQGCWETKLAKIRCAGFKICTKNWLAIYDNLPYAGVKIPRAIEFLRMRTANLWAAEPYFDAIYIETGNYIATLTENKTEIAPINNLWR